MTKPARSSRATARVIPLRKGTTLEMVRLACPDSAQAQRISESFGLAILDSDGIRDLHERLIIKTADALKDGLSERAMQIHLQRIVGAYVGSAHGAGQFYTRAVTEARDATAKLANDGRDEDLDGPVGFDSQAQRKREFAADMGVQSHALRMAAEGASPPYAPSSAPPGPWSCAGPYARATASPSFALLRPCGARTLGSAVADPVRSRDGRGLPNGGHYNEQERRKGARRPVRPHHGPHCR